MSGKKKDLTPQEILDKAMARAFRGGIAGAGAMGIQVVSLMWMRTTMNYQYRNGEKSTLRAIQILYRDGVNSGLAFGGIRRFYMGLGPALFQGPLSRFGDTAANSGTLALLEANPSTNKLPVGIKTFMASCAAAAWRMVIMPIDAMKTISQVATIQKVNKKDSNYMVKKLGRNASIGFAASICSDCCSNSIRVIKTVKQTSTVPITYTAAAKQVIDKDGVMGLLGRGLKTRIMANGMQGIMFKVLWKLFEDKLNAK
eukprot:jgi/Bigna1/46341/estExt_Genewise1.C_30320